MTPLEEDAEPIEAQKQRRLGELRGGQRIEEGQVQPDPSMSFGSQIRVTNRRDGRTEVAVPWSPVPIHLEPGESVMLDVRTSLGSKSLVGDVHAPAA